MIHAALIASLIIGASLSAEMRQPKWALFFFILAGVHSALIIAEAVR